MQRHWQNQTPEVKPSLGRLSIVVASLVAIGCSAEIGDECVLARDCSQSGDRICINTELGGYCTVQGCDFDTCPEESICARFFIAGETNLTCESSADCTPDEICTLSGSCVPRTSEVRYCMRKCGGQGDCREDFECRDEELMREHGGEPVPVPGEPLPDNLQAFCAPGPVEI